MIDIRNVEKKYGPVTALSPVNLQLARGKTHVFLGSSGSGKSTLLRLMSGLMAPTSGEIIIDGEKVSTDRQRHLAGKIGYVIQEGGLFPHLSARDNIGLQARTQGWSQEKTSMRISQLAELVQLEQTLLEQFPKQLSGGQRQRVALMRALMLDPSLLLLDEPLGALDPLVRADLQQELKTIFNQVKKTVILVTHDINEGAYFGHSISLFHNGQLVQHGTFQDLVTAPTSGFVTKFIRAQVPVPEVMALSK